MVKSGGGLEPPPPDPEPPPDPAPPETAPVELPQPL